MSSAAHRKGVERNRTPLVVVAIVVVVALVAGVFGYVRFVWMPHDQASKAYDTAVSQVEQANAKLDKAIGEADKAVKDASQNPPLDGNATSGLKTAIETAGKAKVTIGEKPSKTDELNRLAAKYTPAPDYAKTIETLTAARKTLTDSQKQYAQVTAPNDQFIVQRLTGLPDIDGIQAATEDNDPNHQLNKAGGYIADVFFCSPLVDQSLMEGGVLDKGTDCGGSIESFKTAKEAQARNAYLAAFDGNAILGAGSHEVVGTVVIRTSNELTATQQKTMASNITAALTRLD